MPYTIACVREMILTFHGLGEPAAQLTEAERKVWVPINWFEEILHAMPASGVSLAFDDGNASDEEAALPILTDARRTARFFVIAGRLGAPGYLSREAVASLRDAGMTIGSHGLHHRDWRTLNDSELEEELLESRRALSLVTGSEVDEAACPFGSYDRRVLHALRRAGYRKVYTSDGGTTSSDAWLVPRNSVHVGRPLKMWLELARGGSDTRRLDPVSSAKRVLKRWR
jgi:peptidoglycan/xylan/chitin deacetylase (PgdA/CDA1 family)